MQTPEIALNFGEDGITLEYTPYEREGVSREEILKAVMLEATEIVIGRDKESGKYYLLPRTNDGPVELRKPNGESFYAYGDVELVDDYSEGVLMIAADHQVKAYYPTVVDAPDKPGSQHITVEAFYWPN